MATAPGLGSSGASQLPLDSKFCLKWNNHQVNIVKCFSNLLRNDRFVDVTLAAEGRFLQAHRVILSSCSPYFEDLFSLRPENNAIVFLKDVSFEELQALLDFMYKGEVSISQDKLGTFLRTAESLQIRGLTQSQKSKDSLHNSLTASVPQTSNKSTHKRRRQSEESSDIHSLEGRLSRSHNDGSQSQNQTTLPPLKHRTMLTRAESAADSRRKSQALESNDESVSGNVTFGVEGENIGHSEEWSDEDDAAAVKTDEVLVPQLDVSECQGSWNNSSEVGETAEAGPSRMSVQPLQPDPFPSDVIPVPSFVLTDVLAPSAFALISEAGAEGLHAISSEMLKLEDSEGDDEDEEDAVSELENEDTESPANFVTDTEGNGFSELDKRQGMKARCFMYSCNRCGRLYSKRHSVLRHLRYECGVEPQFQCRICLQRFKHKSDQQRHIRKLHGLDPSEVDDNVH